MTFPLLEGPPRCEGLLVPCRWALAFFAVWFNGTPLWTRIRQTWALVLLHRSFRQDLYCPGSLTVVQLLPIPKPRSRLTSKF